MICADTSFYFSLYGNDANSKHALAWIRDCRQALQVSPYNRFELNNALRFAAFRGVLSPSEAENHLARFSVAIKQGRLIEESINLSEVLDEAGRLSAKYTIERGHRSFDILHVAAANVMHAETFLTFDANQGQLAQSEGLAVPW